VRGIGAEAAAGRQYRRRTGAGYRPAVARIARINSVHIRVIREIRGFTSPARARLNCPDGVEA
jgi:hypothetical protein